MAQSWGVKPKLVLCVAEARGVIPRGVDGPRSLYCRIRFAKTKVRTAVLKKTLAPRWNHVFVFDIPEGESDPALVVKIVDSSGITDQILGSATITEVNKLPPELVVPRTLSARNKKTKKEVEKQVAEIQVVLYVANLPDAPPERALGSTQLDPFVYTDLQFDKQYKTGDIILFSGAGPVATMAKFVVFIFLTQHKLQNHVSDSLLSCRASFVASQ